MKPKVKVPDPGDGISRAAALLRVPLPESEPALSAEIARRADAVVVMLGLDSSVAVPGCAADADEDEDPPQRWVAG